MIGTLNKIHLIGAVGSGKTTLARKLSTSLSLPMYELDNLVWERKKDGDIRRPPEQRDAYLNEMIHLDRWIIEGAQHRWVDQSFQQAELIILLDVPYSQRVGQIIKRYVLQKVGMEKAHYTPSLQLLKKMFGWNNDYQNYERESILKMLEPYKDKLQIISSKKETKAFLNAAVIPSR